jgi:hypothetical protein
VRSSLAMLPRLEAEESLLAVDRLAVGGGHLERDAMRRTLDRWLMAADPSARSPRRRRVMLASPDALADMGIGVTVVPRTNA